MPRLTFANRINSFIEQRNPAIPFTNSQFVRTSLSRISNGQGRPSPLWTSANPCKQDSTLLRTLSWVGFILGWHIDHIKPVVKGGSYHVSNLRILPPALNLFISGSGNWPHDKLNALIDHLGPEWRAELGIPEGFKSLPAEEFLESKFLAKQMKLHKARDRWGRI